MAMPANHPNILLRKFVIELQAPRWQECRFGELLTGEPLAGKGNAAATAATVALTAEPVFALPPEPMCAKGQLAPLLHVPLG